MSWVSVVGPLHPIAKIHLVMPLAPPVGCGVDRGDAHGIHRVRASHMIIDPPPALMWDLGWRCTRDEACIYACIPLMHVQVHACHACVYLYAYAMHAYVDVGTQLRIFMHMGAYAYICHADSTRMGNPSWGPYHGGGP